MASPAHHFWRSLRALARGGRRHRAGVASIEFAVVLSTVVIFVLGTYDLGNILLQRMKLAEAVHAGAVYAGSFPTDTTGISAKISASLPVGWTDVTIGTPSLSCACWTSGGGDTTADCTATPICPIGETTERFMTLTITRPFSPLLISSLSSASVTYVTRIQ